MRMRSSAQDVLGSHLEGLKYALPQEEELVIVNCIWKLEIYEINHSYWKSFSAHTT